MFRKGSFVFRKDAEVSKESSDGAAVKKRKKIVTVEHEDIIGDNFWDQNPGILQA
jgi:hypothetical protein